MYTFSPGFFGWFFAEKRRECAVSYKIRKMLLHSKMRDGSMDLENRGRRLLIEAWYLW